MAIVFLDVDADKISRGQSDPNRGTQDCPIALAAMPKIPTFHHVSCTQLILVDRIGLMRRVDLPPIAREFINKADTQCNVAKGFLKPDKNDIDQEKLKPIRFPVQIPDEYL